MPNLEFRCLHFGINTNTHLALSPSPHHQLKGPKCKRGVVYELV
jgi:hypothetical protein